MDHSSDLPGGLPFGEAGELLTSVVESLDDAVITKTLDGRIVSWNPAAERLYGYAAEEVLGKDVSLLFPLGRESESNALIERVRQGGHMEPFRTVRRRKDGELIEVMLSVSPVRDRSGTIVAATILAREVTDPVSREIERRQLFSRFSGLFHSSTDAIAFASLEGWLVDFNDALLRLTGYTREELLAKRYEILSPDRHQERSRQIAREVLSGKPVEYDKEYLRKDGSHVPIHVTAFPVRSAEGEMIGIAGIIKDMTEIRAREDELSASLQALRRRREDLERQNEEIRRADRVKTEFLNNVSHELRTPLNGIIGFTELLRDRDVGQTPQEQVECLGYVLDASRQLLGLVDDLLAVASYEAGHFEVHPQTAELRQVLANVHCELNERMRMKGLSYQAHIDPGVTDVFTDVQKLSHLLFHFIDNAIKFTPPGGQVIVRVGADTAKTFLVEVEDTGIGVPPEMQSELFRVFQKGDTSLTRHHAGLGLGLALCKRIVEGEGGEIGMRSTPGKGSTFFARLPRRLEQPAVDADTRVPPRSPRVLIVNSEELREPLIPILRRAGCEILTVEGGAEALDISRREPFDLMYTGLVLPDMSGLDLLKAFQQSPDHRDIPIVVLAQVAADQPGISIRDVLLPPYRTSEVLATLRHSIGDPAAPARTWA